MDIGRREKLVLIEDYASQIIRIVENEKNGNLYLTLNETLGDKVKRLDALVADLLDAERREDPRLPA